MAGLIDFWKWEYDYGHDLDTVNAIIKIPGMSYQPPVIGSRQLLNFTATSWPAAERRLYTRSQRCLVRAKTMICPGRRSSSSSSLSCFSCWVTWITDCWIFSGALNSLPTVIEAGYPSLVSTVWTGFFLPAKTPKAIADKVGAAVINVAETPEIREKLMQLG